MTQTPMENALVSRYLLAQGFGQGPDFIIHSGAMQADETADDGRPILRMVGSSTEKDLQGDTMMITALQDMQNVPLNLTIWLNHSYTLPDDVFGGLADKPLIMQQNGIADLHLKVEVEMENPLAAKTYSMITKGKRRFGCSVGCQVLAYDFDGEPDAFHAPILVYHVATMEWSVVGIPANQRSWVENAVYGLFARSLVEGRADDALKLAPAVKGMYSRDYEKIVRNIEVNALRKDLERVPSRSTHPQRIFFDFTRDTFALGDRTGALKSIARADLADLVASGAPLHKQDSTPVVPSWRAGSEEMLVTPHDAEVEPQIQKTATGKSDWPLADRDRAWDAGEAHKRLKTWATNDDGSLNPTKFKSVHFFVDADNSDQVGAYKLAFCDLIAGEVKAVPRGIFACAGSHGVDAADIPDADKSSIHGKISAYYHRMAKAFGDDSIVAPWDKEKNGGATTLKSGTDTSKDIVDSESGAALNRQDLDEHPKGKDTDTMDEKKDQQQQPDDIVKAADVSVASDGTHALCKGVHTHAHKAYGSQGGDETHEHAHSHDGDAHHGHSHDAAAEKSADDAVPVTKSVDEEQQQQADTHTQEQPHTESGETPSEAGATTDTTTAEDDARLPASATKTAAAPVSTTATENASVSDMDPQSLALLGVYNDIGKKLGLPAASLNKKDMGDSTNMQGVVTMLSQLDDLMDGAQDTVNAIGQAGTIVDALLTAFGVPDIDEERASSLAGDTPYLLPATWSVDVQVEKALRGLTVLKEGRALSTSNAQKLQQAHDLIHAVHPDCCKNMGTTTESVQGDGTSHQGSGITVDEAQREANFVMGDLTASLVPGMEHLAKALGGFNLKGIEQEVQQTMTSITDAKKELADLRQMVEVLKNAPLGRPTGLQRTVAGEATYQDMTSVAATSTTAASDALHTAPATTLKDALMQTEVLTKSGTFGKMEYRRWPAGVAKGFRPALTGDQMSLMLGQQIVAYNEGEAADVPMIDDPAELVA